MGYGILFVVHIAGAVATGFGAVYACTVMFRSETAAYRAAAIALGILAAFEVATGAALAVLSPSVTIISVCGNIALYLAAVGFVQTLIFMRMKQSVLNFPVTQVTSPIGASLALVITAFVLGF